MALRLIHKEGEGTIVRSRHGIFEFEVTQVFRHEGRSITHVNFMRDGKFKHSFLLCNWMPSVRISEGFLIELDKKQTRKERTIRLHYSAAPEYLIDRKRFRDDGQMKSRVFNNSLP